MAEHWNVEQFNHRLRVSRETFNIILEDVVLTFQSSLQSLSHIRPLPNIALTLIGMGCLRSYLDWGGSNYPPPPPVIFCHTQQARSVGLRP